MSPVSSPNPALEIEILSAENAARQLDLLADILLGCVEGGAGVGFVQPFSHAEAVRFWQSRLPGIENGERYLLAAMEAGSPVGTVMLDLAPQDNGRHRAEVAKLLVHPDFRRRGIARKLLEALDQLAVSLGRTLLVLDTVTGDTAEGLYPQCGYIRVGVIPDYARHPVEGYSATTVFYKQL
ncbi:GNAT family N-acetyltransferase [Labrenzia suaedae]|uniref:GNAT family N-acetyltransferase n=2 Tax=Roseibium litorale TaxID=2803841 RepID=A0ABR9CJ81_9HYPH|nr:GNAT family N-acetyltransferase [Roseibium litorale]